MQTAIDAILDARLEIDGHAQPRPASAGSVPALAGLGDNRLATVS